MHEGAAVVDGDDDAAAAMGHPELGAERQGAMGCGQGILIEALAGGCLAAGFVAVEGGHPRKAAPRTRRRGDRGIGVAPGSRSRAIRTIAGVVEVMVVAMMMPGFGGSFSDASPDQESCGDNGKRRARLS